jgi:hypothetical protein
MKTIWKTMTAFGVCLALLAIPLQTVNADDWSDCSGEAGKAVQDCIIAAVGLALGAAVVCSVGSGGIGTLACSGLSTAALVLAAAACAGVGVVAWDWCWAQKDFGYNDQKSTDKLVAIPTSVSPLI